MGELVKNNVLGCKVAAVGLEGPGLNASSGGEDEDWLVFQDILHERGWDSCRGWFGLAGNEYLLGGEFGLVIKDSNKLVESKNGNYWYRIDLY